MGIYIAGLIVIILQIIIIGLIKSNSSSHNDLDFDKSLTSFEKRLRDELQIIRKDSRELAQEGRVELGNNLNAFGNSLLKRLHESSVMQKGQLEIFSQQLVELTKQNSSTLEIIRDTVEKRLTELQKDNNQKLEKMREIVDEKLQSTLEKRLAQSFQSVSERLEQVHKGLGEMQHLAVGVGDLKKVLSNVKTRGTWGEVQLGNLLEQILTKEQYQANVATKKDSNDIVEYAIKLPGKDKNLSHIWLPIDAKFPIEDYQRLLEAEDSNDRASIDIANKAIEKRLKDEGKKIKTKYIDPPNTTDFAILFIPIEGLYAQVLKLPGLVDFIQREYRVMITGPTTITAILNSLQMGFRTLAIEKQSSEIWQTLSEVKTEFGRFGEILERTQKKLQEASNQIDAGATRARAIERKLKNVDTLEISKVEVDVIEAELEL
ncbi:DNA recombination protein RmuC [bacterium]|nr:DNA recombination protein RmuC [Candidatus Elulimicrobium humile]